MIIRKLGQGLDVSALSLGCMGYGKTRDIPDRAEMIRLIRNARGNILGAILNKMRLSTADYYYYYYYYDYAKETPVSRPLGGAPTPAPEIDVEEPLEVLDEPMRPAAPSADEVFGPEIQPREEDQSVFDELYGDTPPKPPAAPPTPLQIDDVQVEEPPPEEKKPNGTRRNGHSNGHRNGNGNNGGSLLDDLLGPDLDDF